MLLIYLDMIYIVNVVVIVDGADDHVMLYRVNLLQSSP